MTRSHAGHDDGWGTLGGAVEPGESPAVAAVYEARIVAGSPATADGELSELGWLRPEELPSLRLNGFARALPRALGRPLTAAERMPNSLAAGMMAR